MPTDLKPHIANFKKWLATDTEKAAAWQKERKERLAWYREHLAKDRIAKLSAEVFATLIKDLWAVNFWHNKDYKVGRLIKDNGLERLRNYLADLLHGSEPLGKRWDSFRSSIKGFGPSSLSEILAFFDPQRYALVNLKPYRVFPIIGLPITPVNDGNSYMKAVEEIGTVKKELENAGMPPVDFILTDFFVFYLFSEVFDLEHKRKDAIIAPPSTAEEEPVPHTPADAQLVIDSHESAEAVLLMLGNLLEYDTYTPDAGRTYREHKLGEIATLEDLLPFTSEKIMDSVRNIDVVWLKDEWPEYFFEVEHTTGVTSGLLRIYQAQKLNTKFFIIGPKDVLKKFEKEVQKAPFSAIKEKYCFRSYEDLRDMYLSAAQFRKSSAQFFG